MHKRHYFAAVCVVAALAVAVFWLKSGSSPDNGLPDQKRAPHAYNEPSLNIRKIGLKVFYAVPKNQLSQSAKDWKMQIEPVLKEVSDFHAAQFHFSSQVVPEIYFEPVTLEKENLYYDTADTNYGNPEGLKRVVPELMRRFPEFVKVREGEYRVVAVIYEGVGAAGTLGSMILSREYMSDQDYQSIRSALFYHEFAHTFGLPDKYELVNSQPFSNDIMGRGRFRQIFTNYIDPESIKAMGLAG